MIDCLDASGRGPITSRWHLRLNAEIEGDPTYRVAGAGRRVGLTRRTRCGTRRRHGREDTGDARLVAEYLGHADLSTVSRYAHVAAPELQTAADSLAAHAGLVPPLGSYEHQLRFEP